MADFDAAYDRVIAEEGGYQLTNIANDRGSTTYAGISRKFHPQWDGWKFLDAGDTPPTTLVREFYKQNFWDKCRGDSIIAQDVAEAIYSAFVNMGVPALKMAQMVVGVAADGKVGPKTLFAINAMPSQQFKPWYALAMIARYTEIVGKDKTQLKFLRGWNKRALKVAA